MVGPGWALVVIPVILATHEAEIRRIKIQSQPGQNTSRDPISKNPITKKRAGGVVQDLGPQLKPWHSRKKRKKKRKNL
jgi:hypothetical protein